MRYGFIIRERTLQLIAGAHEEQRHCCTHRPAPLYVRQTLFYPRAQSIYKSTTGPKENSPDRTNKRICPEGKKKERLAPEIDGLLLDFKRHSAIFSPWKKNKNKK